MPRLLNKLVADGGIQIPAGAGAGLVATSDANGNISWQAAAGAPASDLNYDKAPVDYTTFDGVNVNIASPPTSFDGYTVGGGQRILLRAQTDKTQNGIWVYGTPMTRATDCDASGELRHGASVRVLSGRKHRGATFYADSLGSGNTIVPGTTQHTWSHEEPLRPVKDQVRCCAVGSLSNPAIPGATIDGITMVAGDRFLVKDNTNTLNGIWIWLSATAAIRADDMDIDQFGDYYQQGAMVYVVEGATYGKSLWVMTDQDLSNNQIWARVDGPNRARITTDQTSSATAVASIPGFTFTMVAGKVYKIIGSLIYRTAALTTGIRIQAAMPALTSGALDVGMQNFAADGSGAKFHGTINANGDSVLSTAVAVINSDAVIEISGVLIASAGGTFQLQYATEVAASNAIIRPGSYMEWDIIG